MARRLLRNALLLDPEAEAEAPGGLLLEAGRIQARIGPEEPGPEDAEWIDLGGRALAPGFLDVHHHGSLIFEQPDAYSESLRQTAASCLRHGTTGYLATTVAWPADELLTRVEALARCTAEGSSELATVLGIHLEGPWIRAEAAGAQPGPGIRPYDAREAAELFDRADGAIRLATLAPEIEGAEALQRELARRGIVAALGHSLARPSEVEAAVEAGLRHVTHLFNAMGTLHHRELGVAGAVLTDDRLSCDLICDGVHVHPAFVRLAARAKGPELVLITDRMEVPDDAAHDAGYGAGAVHADGDAIRLADGTLAGSSLTLDRAVRNAVGFGAMTRLEAVAAVTLRPARLLGLENQRGRLQPGARADLVVLSAAGEVEETWLAGERVYAAG